MSLLAAPYVNLTWTATALTTAFRAYRIYRRPAQGVAGAMTLIGEITVPTGYTPATVEAQHIRFRDYEAGWALTNGTWADGWDYTITVVNATTGLESAFATLDGRNIVPAETPWVVSNGQPYLNTPLEILQGISIDEPVRRTIHQTADSDFYSVRSEIRKPGRTFNATFQPFTETGWDQLRYLEAMQESGNNVALHTRLGDRIIGPLALTGSGSGRVRRLPTGINVVETTRACTSVADYNSPAGLAFDGSNDYITHGDITDPSSLPFTFLMAARFPGSTVVPMSKGNVGAPGDGYMLITSASAMSATIDGATAQVSVSETSGVWFDGDVHVACVTTSGTVQKLYRDGTRVGSQGATAHGSVNNNVALVAGAYNGGASLFSALNPLRAYALFYRELTAAEVLAASRYLLGYPGYRMPAGAVLFVDLRDDRCWNGISTNVVDLSGNGLAGTITGGPPTRGIPWPLSTLDAA